MPDSPPAGDQPLVDDPAGRVAPDDPALPQTEAVTEALAPLADQPVEEHAAAFEQVHDRLRDRLRDVDNG